MEILPYETSLSSALTAYYNRAVSEVPHCYPVSGDEFAAALAPVVGEGVRHERLHSEAAFVAREGSALLGFVHAAVGTLEDSEEVRGAIRFLSYERGYRFVGQALLEAAENHLRAMEMSRLQAHHCDDGYRFYHVRYGHLSDHLEHVQALLKMNGYAAVEGEVILDWREYTPLEPAMPEGEAEIELEWRDGRGQRPNLLVKAVRGGENIAVCYTESCGEFSDAEAVQEEVFVNWLWVKDELHRQGWGRYVLQRNLQEMRRIGYRHASISTDWKNHRALLFYSNYGFRMADWTFCYEKTLETPDEPDDEATG